MTPQEAGQGLYVIFNGTCGLCNRFVVFALRRESRASLWFASNHSAGAQQLLARVDLVGADAETIVVIYGDRAIVRSSAMLLVMSHLRWPWKAAAVLRIVPRFLRDWVYSIVSRNRVRIFGAVKECSLLPLELRSRIIE